MKQHKLNSSLNHPNICIFLLCGLVIAKPALSQVDAGALQQNLERQFPAPDQVPLPKPEFNQQEEDSVPSKTKSTDISFKLNRIDLEGVNLLPESSVQEAIKNWIGKEVGFDDLERISNQIINFYRKNGFTVQAIIPPQKIIDGVVKIVVTEAKLGEVIIDAPPGYSPYAKELAAKFITYENPIGDPLNINNLQHALIIMNETPGIIGTSQLEPGKNTGETNVRLKMREPASNIVSRAELNNYGSRTTGANQAVVSLNFIGTGQQGAINALASEGTAFIQGSYSVLVAPNGLKLGAYGNYLNYKNVSNYASLYNGNGDAWTAGVNATYPLVRTQTSNLNGTINFDVKSYMNKYIPNNAVVSSYNIKNISAGLSGNHVDSLIGYRGVSVGSISVVLGYLDVLGTTPTYYQSYALAPGVYTSYVPSTFAKVTFSGNRNQELTSDGSTSLYLSVSGQLASANLNSAEQFYLGGPYGVRAYPVAQAPGAQGGLASAELRQLLPQNFTLSAFFDAGVVQQYKNLYPGWQGLTNANNTYSLMGAGLGLKWAYGSWNINGSVAWKVGRNPLYSYTGQPVNVDGTSTNPRGWITASYTF